MLIGTSLSKEDFSFFRHYHTKQYTMTHAQTHTQITHSTHFLNKRHQNALIREAEKGYSLKCLAGWCLVYITSDAAKWWGLLSRECANHNFLKGRPHQHSFPVWWCENVAPLLSKMPQWRWMLVIYRRPGCDEGEAKCKLSAHIETPLQTGRKEAKWCYRQDGAGA